MADIFGLRGGAAGGSSSSTTTTTTTSTSTASGSNGQQQQTGTFGVGSASIIGTGEQLCRIVETEVCGEPFQKCDDVCTLSYSCRVCNPV